MSEIDVAGLVAEHGYLTGEIEAARARCRDIETLIAGIPKPASGFEVVGTTLVRWGWAPAKRTGWDHDRLRSLIAARVTESVPDIRAVVHVSGEVLDLDDGGARYLLPVANRALAATGKSGYTASGTKPLGIDLDDFCETEPGHPRVTIDHGAAS